MRAIGLAALGVLAAASAAAEAPLWQVDEDASRLAFVGRQNDNEVRGHFEEFTASIRFAPDRLAASSVRVEVDMTSAVVEGGGQREEVLRSSAWFFVEDFPRAVFTAEQFEPTADGYRAIGTLRIRSFEHEVPVDFTVAIEGDRAVADGRAEFLRTAFEVGPEGAAFGVRVAPEVDVTFHLEAERTE